MLHPPRMFLLSLELGSANGSRLLPGIWEPGLLVPLCLLAGALLGLLAAFLWRRRSAAAAVKKSWAFHGLLLEEALDPAIVFDTATRRVRLANGRATDLFGRHGDCLLYTSPSPRD